MAKWWPRTATTASAFAVMAITSAQATVAASHPPIQAEHPCRYDAPAATSSPRRPRPATTTRSPSSAEEPRQQLLGHDAVHGRAAERRDRLRRADRVVARRLVERRAQGGREPRRLHD